MAPQYKLTYFNSRGLAEMTRLIFAYAGVDYEDVRIEMGPQWDELKPKTPFEKLPILEFDGVVIAQSRAIARYVAHQYGLAGKTPLDSAKCDMLVDALFDLYPHMAKWAYEQDAEKKAEFFDDLLKTVANYLNYTQKYLQSREHFVGDSLTWADLTIAHMLWTLTTLSATVLDNYPELKSFQNKILNIPKIKEWIDKRPESPMYIL